VLVTIVGKKVGGNAKKMPQAAGSFSSLPGYSHGDDNKRFRVPIAILGGNPRRFLPLAEAYREAGHIVEQLNVAVTGHAYIAETTNKPRMNIFLII
jgi:hypothetical protein